MKEELRFTAVKKKRRIPWVSPRFIESICRNQMVLMNGEEMAGSCLGVRQTSSGLLSCSLVLLLLSESSTDKQDTWAEWLADSTRDRQASSRNIIHSNSILWENPEIRNRDYQPVTCAQHVYQPRGCAPAKTEACRPTSLSTGVKA